MLINMIAKQTWPQDQLSVIFAALADPTRRAMLARLRLGAASVNTLAEPFTISLPAISRHLKVLERAGLVVRGCVAARAPWWVRNARIHGRFVAATTECGYTLWVTNNERADGSGHCFLPRPPGEFDGLTESEIDRLFWRKGVAYIRAHPAHFVRLAGAKFVRFWRPWPHTDEVGAAVAVVGGVSFVPLLLLALWGLARSRAQWRPVLLFVLLFGYYTALHMVFMAITRYRVPMMPYVIVLAAWGMVRAYERLVRRHSRIN